ncbi:hypothetical protein IV203_006208 [Nitzschia inconspicua]|uniref:Peptidylprolyl isomerase n=1 Tax=Nitzschia inconspicua TaxID=303405 RepID=A0A9K3KPR1_9STRA|nr:hypothetical protein IV203_006208 [Nitzschia inconspicua]
MASKLDFSKQFGTGYVPEDKDQALVETPFGRGVVIRTRYNVTTGETTKEIELTDWTQPFDETATKSFTKPHMLYSTQSFPSIPSTVGSDVLTQWGRGKVIEIRNDKQQTHVVQLSSWRLAGRSKVKCFVAAQNIQVVRPFRIYDMSVFEKVEHANELKQQATSKFIAKEYDAALQLYAKAVDAVRYIQHGPDSSNELRADLVVVMVTCSNNSGTCCLQLKDWEHAAKYGMNALALLDALEKKKDSSKILKIMNKDGISDSQLFGAWKVKSLLLIGKSQLEKYEPSDAIETMKKGLDAISTYKKEGDPMFKQLQSQEKEIRKLYAECTQKIKEIRKKEKQRAKAMFSGGEQETKDTKKNSSNEAFAPPRSSTPDNATGMSEGGGSPRSVTFMNSNEAEIESQSPHDVPPQPLKKRVSFADGSSPGDDIDDHEPSFFEEHMEALLLLAGFGLGCWLASIAWKKR